MKPYTTAFYASIQEAARASAEVIVPLVLELISPRSVIDVGCGTGEWLAAFQRHGVVDFLGVDGGWVDTALLQIPSDRFLRVDLGSPIQIPREFDLVVSLEVAEHLPAQSAVSFVRSLTSLGPVILFSAAIPRQGGTDHINEQWPQYWAGHFLTCGYVPVDCVRRRVWEDPKVEFWYAQNSFIYVKRDQLQRYPVLEKEYRNGSGLPMSMVHPKLYGWRAIDAGEVGDRDRMIRALQAELEEKTALRDRIIQDLQAELHAKVGERDRMIMALQAELEEKTALRDQIIRDLQTELRRRSKT